MFGLAEVKMTLLNFFSLLPSNYSKKGYFPYYNEKSILHDSMRVKGDKYIIGHNKDKDNIENFVNCDLTVEDDLRGCNYGDWSGSFIKDIPLDLISLWINDVSFSPPNGESRYQMYHRVSAWLNCKLYSEGNIIFFLRPEVVKAIILSVLNIKYENENCLDIFYNTWTIISKNKNFKLQGFSLPYIR